MRRCWGATNHLWGCHSTTPHSVQVVSTYIGYYFTSISLLNISRGFNINLQALQAILSLCTQTLSIVGYSTLELLL